MRLTTLLLAATLAAGSGCGTTSTALDKDNLEDKVVKTIDYDYIDEDGFKGTKMYYRKEGQLIKTKIIASNDFRTYYDVIIYDAQGRVETKSHVWIEDNETRNNPAAERARWLTTFTYRDDGYVQKTVLNNISSKSNTRHYNSITVKLTDSKNHVVKALDGDLTYEGLIDQGNIFTFDQGYQIVNSEHINGGKLSLTNNHPNNDGTIRFDNDPTITYTEDVQLMPKISFVEISFNSVLARMFAIAANNDDKIATKV